MNDKTENHVFKIAFKVLVSIMIIGALIGGLAGIINGLVDVFMNLGNVRGFDLFLIVALQFVKYVLIGTITGVVITMGAVVIELLLHKGKKMDRLKQSSLFLAVSVISFITFAFIMSVVDWLSFIQSLVIVSVCLFFAGSCLSFVLGLKRIIFMLLKRIKPSRI